MTIRIHFVTDGIKAFFDVTGETVKEIKEAVAAEVKKRRLDQQKNKLRSEWLKR